MKGKDEGGRMKDETEKLGQSEVFFIPPPSSFIPS
jgi:hypothetical protein